MIETDQQPHIEETIRIFSFVKNALDNQNQDEDPSATLVEPKSYEKIKPPKKYFKAMKRFKEVNKKSLDSARANRKKI